LAYGPSARRGMNVILQGDGKPSGVLEVDSRSEDEFVAHDLAFLQGAANILGSWWPADSVVNVE
jgi:putative methionine-R-sulfoxide reductase with GAF domain